MVNIDVTYDANQGKIFLFSPTTLGIDLRVLESKDNDYAEIGLGWNLILENSAHYWVQHDFMVNNENFKIQIFDESNLVKYQEIIFKSSDLLYHPKICVTTVMFNEIEILPFFVDYYFNKLKVSKIIFCDGGSTDGSIEFLKSLNYNIEIINQNDAKYDEFTLVNARNNMWRKYKNDFDWFIVCDCDEFLYHENFGNLLNKYKLSNISVPKVMGYEMISLNMPKFCDNKFITDQIKEGFRAKNLDKCVLFNPNMVDMNYSFGSHQCFPSGKVIQNGFDDNLYLLEYKYLSYDYLIQKRKFGSQRRSENSISWRHAEHWTTEVNMSENEYQELKNKCIKVI